MKLVRLIERLMGVYESSPDADVRFHTANRSDLDVLSIYAKGAPSSAGIAGVKWPKIKLLEIDIGKDEQ